MPGGNHIVRAQDDHCVCVCVCVCVFVFVFVAYRACIGETSAPQGSNKELQHCEEKQNVCVCTQGGSHPTDVRMTTRFKEGDVLEGLTGAVHETGTHTHTHTHTKKTTMPILLCRLRALPRYTLARRVFVRRRARGAALCARTHTHIHTHATPRFMRTCLTVQIEDAWRNLCAHTHTQTHTYL